MSVITSIRTREDTDITHRHDDWIYVQQLPRNDKPGSLVNICGANHRDIDHFIDCLNLLKSTLPPD